MKHVDAYGLSCLISECMDCYPGCPCWGHRGADWVIGVTHCIMKVEYSWANLFTEVKLIGAKSSEIFPHGDMTQVTLIWKKT